MELRVRARLLRDADHPSYDAFWRTFDIEARHAEFDVAGVSSHRLVRRAAERDARTSPACARTRATTRAPEPATGHRAVDALAADAAHDVDRRRRLRAERRLRLSTRSSALVRLLAQGRADRRAVAARRCALRDGRQRVARRAGVAARASTCRRRSICTAAAQREHARRRRPAQRHRSRAASGRYVHLRPANPVPTGARGGYSRRPERSARRGAAAATCSSTRPPPLTRRRGDRADRRADALGRVVGDRHRLHRQARGRVSRRHGARAHRRHPSRPLPSEQRRRCCSRLASRGVDDRRRRDQQRLPRRPSHPRRDLEQQLPALRSQSEHRGGVRRGAERRRADRPSSTTPRHRRASCCRSCRDEARLLVCLRLRRDVHDRCRRLASCLAAASLRRSGSATPHDAFAAERARAAVSRSGVRRPISAFHAAPPTAAHGRNRRRAASSPNRSRRWLRRAGLDGRDASSTTRISRIRCARSRSSVRRRRVGCFGVTEPASPLDPDTNNPSSGRGFVAYSASGDVTAPVVYANYGLPADYAQLEARVRRRIARIARYGNSHRAVKLYTAERPAPRGSSSTAIPPTTGSARRHVARGYWRAGQLQRGNGKYSWFWHGDPLTPACPRRRAARLDPETAPTLPRIPAAVVRGARRGKFSSDSTDGRAGRMFQGALRSPRHVGRGRCAFGCRRHDQRPAHHPRRRRARARRAASPTAGVFGHPPRCVDVRRRRSGTGTATLLEVARGLGALRRAGWRPERTISFAFWDAEEFGLIGSTEYAEHRQRSCGGTLVCYINTDLYTNGRLDAGGVPSLRDFLSESRRTFPTALAPCTTRGAAERSRTPPAAPRSGRISRSSSRRSAVARISCPFRISSGCRRYPIEYNATGGIATARITRTTTRATSWSTSPIRDSSAALSSRGCWARWCCDSASRRAAVPVFTLRETTRRVCRDRHAMGGRQRRTTSRCRSTSRRCVAPSIAPPSRRDSSSGASTPTRRRRAVLLRRSPASMTCSPAWSSASSTKASPTAVVPPSHLRVEHLLAVRRPAVSRLAEALRVKDAARATAEVGRIERALDRMSTELTRGRALVR